MRLISIAERLGMAEARGARMESKLIGQEAVIRSLVMHVKQMERAFQIAIDAASTPAPPMLDLASVTAPARALQSRMADIAAQVAFAHGLTVDALRGRDTGRSISHPRQEAMLLMHMTGYSMPQIGRFFSRDHTTVLHGIRAARARMEGSGK